VQGKLLRDDTIAEAGLTAQVKDAEAAQLYPEVVAG
jgi:hypothetical protein